MEAPAVRATRRTFLAWAAGSFALLVAGCGGEGDATSSRPTTSVDPEAAPPMPELSEMEPQFVDDARAYLVGIPGALLPRARALLPPEVHQGLEAGLLALSDVCPSDQMQLRFCESARWFECPACGSKFDILGAWQAGPAPRGMTMHGVAIEGAMRDVSVVSHPKLPGLANGTRLAVQEAAGPFCA